MNEKLFSENGLVVAGVDEAGRGPLAGPVVAACFLFDEEKFKLFSDYNVTDSKKISAKNRTKIKQKIDELGMQYGVGVVGHEVIDRINILQATFLAMTEAIKNLESKAGDVSVLMIDGDKKIPGLKQKQIAIIKGDSLIKSISFASIVAKTVRDEIMDGYDKEYPLYEYKKHKGYGTQKHREIIKEFGPSPIQRKSFVVK